MLSVICQKSMCKLGMSDGFFFFLHYLVSGLSIEGFKIFRKVSLGMKAVFFMQKIPFVLHNVKILDSKGSS